MNPLDLDLSEKIIKEIQKNCSENLEIKNLTFSAMTIRYNHNQKVIDRYVFIPYETYINLIADNEFLKRLEANGVNNWEGYSSCCEENFEGE